LIAEAGLPAPSVGIDPVDGELVLDWVGRGVACSIRDDGRVLILLLDHYIELRLPGDHLKMMVLLRQELSK
jgi:hypothetical protein